MRRLAVLGDPVSHSRSPAMQTAALEALGLAEEWSYEAIRVPSSELGERVEALAERGFAGVNVTIPHKEAALALADDASQQAREIGAANTLSFDAGRVRADNTDASGLLAALPRSPGGERALVLGAGGSARAAAWALSRSGASVEVWNRTAARADELVRALARAAAGASEDSPLLAPVSAEQARSADYGLIVNCTAVGLSGRGEDPFSALPIEADRLSGVVVVDFVYGHRETELVVESRKRGAEVVDGLEVLVRQGAESLRIWTGREAPLEVMRKAVRR